jgi:hypothetical protein
MFLPRSTSSSRREHLARHQGQTVYSSFKADVMAMSLPATLPNRLGIPAAFTQANPSATGSHESRVSFQDAHKVK